MLLLTEDRAAVRLLTLNRPEALNAFSDALYSAAADALEAAAADDTVAVIVITGAGRAFSAGADLKEMQALGRSRIDGDGPRGRSAFPRFVNILSGCPKPVIAAVNGLAVGIGFTMLAHCDLVLAAESARFRTPFTSLGVAPEAASSHLFPLRLGWQHAAWLLFSSEWASAAELQHYGMVWRVTADGAVVDEAMAAAATIAKWPLASIMETKRVLLDGRLPAVARARELEDQAFSRLLGSEANAAALAEFTRRSPSGSAPRPPL